MENLNRKFKESEPYHNRGTVIVNMREQFDHADIDQHGSDQFKPQLQTGQAILIIMIFISYDFIGSVIALDNL